MLNKIIFGEKLKNYRKEKKLTQSQVAKEIGISTQAVSKWEKGDCLPDLWNTKLLCRLYGVSADEMLNFDDINTEKIIESYKFDNAVFELVERSEKTYAGGKLDEQIEDFSHISGKSLPEHDVISA